MATIYKVIIWTDHINTLPETLESRLKGVMGLIEEPHNRIGFEKIGLDEYEIVSDYINYTKEDLEYRLSKAVLTIQEPHNRIHVEVKTRS